MCFYNQVVWTCGSWRWSAFQYRCHKEYRIGETCGLKLVCDVEYKTQQCNLCHSLSIKHRRAAKMEVDLARWLGQGNRPATVQKTQSELSRIRKETFALAIMHPEGVRNLPPIRNMPSPRWAVDRSKYLVNDISSRYVKISELRWI